MFGASKTRFRVVTAGFVLFCGLLTTNSAFAAFGKPSISTAHSGNIYSINGTNFVASSQVQVTFKAGAAAKTLPVRVAQSGSFSARFQINGTLPAGSVATARSGATNLSLALTKPATANAKTTTGSSIALVYRGPAGCDGCSEAAAALVTNSPEHFKVTYVGPKDAPVTAQLLSTASLYVQPGGGDDLNSAWKSVEPTAPLIKNFVSQGGHYLGFCMGGYLAGADPGFNLLPGNTDAYVGSPGATVKTSDDTLVKVNWRGKTRTMYFQDGNIVKLNKNSGATVLATFPNNEIAAVVAPYGKGKVAVSGPHPEADSSWYRDARLTDPDGPDADLGYDLINTLMK